MRSGLLRAGGTAAQVAGSQFAVAACYYAVLALAARRLDAAGFAAVSAYYLLINAVGRGLFAAVELETTRAVARAAATGTGEGAARRAARSHTLMLLAGALVLLAASTPLLARVVGSGAATIGLLAVGAVTLAVSYLLRGPLAGRRRYGPYAATFWAEAVAALAGAGALAVAGVGSTAAWIAVLALAPLAAVVAPGAATRDSKATPLPPHGSKATPLPVRAGEGGGRRGAVLWSAALLLAGQGVWNLGPVVLTARLADAPAVAAGFTTAAVILRAPVLFFPSLQALLLPRLTAMAGDGVRRVVRVLVGLIAVAGLVWVLAAVLVVPELARLVFATTVAPAPLLLGLLALSTMVGAAAQIGQTRLVAEGRPARAAIGWLVALAVLLGTALLAAPPVVAATVGQLAAAVVAAAVLLWRPGRMRR